MVMLPTSFTPGMKIASSRNGLLVARPGSGRRRRRRSPGCAARAGRPAPPDAGHRLDELHDHQGGALPHPAVGLGRLAARTSAPAPSGPGSRSDRSAPSRKSSVSSRIADADHGQRRGDQAVEAGLQHAPGWRRRRWWTGDTTRPDVYRSWNATSSRWKCRNTRRRSSSSTFWPIRPERCRKNIRLIGLDQHDARTARRR